VIIKTSKKERTRKRHRRIRTKVFGTKSKPRLSVFKSNKHIYAQMIDDETAHTLLSLSTNTPSIKGEIKSTWTKQSAQKLGEMVAKLAVKNGVKKVVFDRGGNKYHGKILSFAQEARKHGLEF